MVDNEIYDYKLSMGQNQLILSMKINNNNILFIIDNQNGEKYSSSVSLPQLKSVCDAFQSISSLNQSLIPLNNTIESGNIFLTPDKERNLIKLKLVIEDSPFIVNLVLNEEEEKYGTTTANTTEYNKPIVQSNYNNPVQLEYIEPIVQYHYPDGTTKSTVLPARIQSIGGEMANIDEDQFKYIQEQMNLHMNNKDTNKYSLNTVPNKKNFENIVDNKNLYNNIDLDKSKYSTATIPAKPIVLSEKKMFTNIINRNQATHNNQNYEDDNADLSSDIEALFRTETGLIIFRNGILKGIIHTYSEIDDVVSKIQLRLSKGVKFKLLYRASMHGDKANIFHEKCDSQKMSLVLVETNKGNRFGGFTSKSWGGYCKKKFDKYAFVFNINNNKIYDIKDNEPAIGCYPKFGPAFLGCQIRIYDDCFTKGGTTCHRSLNYKTDKDYELNNGEQTFIVKDIEIYGIEPVDV